MKIVVTLLLCAAGLGVARLLSRRAPVHRAARPAVAKFPDTAFRYRGATHPNTTRTPRDKLKLIKKNRRGK